MLINVQTQWKLDKGYKGYKDGLQPETLAVGNWLVKQNQLMTTSVKN